ncbi:MAG: hypothetical protein ACOZAM_22115 [Pseudomonadota bacterium]
MPLRRETRRLLARMIQSVEERALHMRAIRKANLDAEEQSWKRIGDSRKLLAETTGIAKGYTPTKR